MAVLSPVAKQQFFDNAGNPAAGYKLYTYAANSTTPQATYADRAGTVPNANPIVLDAAGRATIYLDPALTYDYVLKTADGVTVWTQEDVVAAVANAAEIGFLQSGTGAVARTIEDRLRERVSVKDYGALGDGATNDTAAIQAAIDHVAARASSQAGGFVYLPSGIYLASGIVLKDFVYLIGAGELATVIRIPDGANEDCIKIMSGVAGVGVSHLTVDGNKGNNLVSGSGIYIEATPGSGGDSFFPYSQKVGDSADAYKHCRIDHVTVGNCCEHGIFKAAGGAFQVSITNFTVSHNGKHGLFAGGTDCEYAFFYAEKNGWAGVYCPNGSNKFTSGKCIWNGRTDNTYAGFFIKTQSATAVQNTLLIGIEAQDNYCNGIYVEGRDISLVGCMSNQNGYSAVGSEGVSSRVHSNWVFNNVTRCSVVACKSFTYFSAVGSDGFWTTEYPYKLTGTNTFKVFDISYDPATTNSRPSPSAYTENRTTPLLSEVTQSSDGLSTLHDLSPLSESGTGTATIRLFRNTGAGSEARLDVVQPGTANVQHRLTGVGDSNMNILGGDFIVGHAATGGKWNTGHARLGPYHVWVDGSGRLRIKGSAPTSDTDGAVVGGQS